MGTKPKDVAKWMLEKLNNEDVLSQEDAVFEIEKNFGAEFVYENDNGNSAINKNVLEAFRKITGDDVVWERGEKSWRFREPYDEPGRQQS